jgi:hypothetical protein
LQCHPEAKRLRAERVNRDRHLQELATDAEAARRQRGAEEGEEIPPPRGVATWRGKELAEAL